MTNSGFDRKSNSRVSDPLAPFQPRHEIGADPERDLIDLQSWTRSDLESILDRARAFRSGSRVRCPDRCVALYFSEASTRTVGSFAVAAHRLGAGVVEFIAERSSATKGETLEDTARTIDAFGVDALVMRVTEVGAPTICTEITRCAVVNAGDGVGGHPTQALLDSLTLIDVLGDLDSKRIAIVGDIEHSRVARSNLQAWTRLGATVVLVGTSDLRTEFGDRENVEIADDLDSVLATVDAVEALRVQKERHGTGTNSKGSGSVDARRLGDLRIDTDRLARAGNPWVLHPGPFNRGVEIMDEVADGERSLIWHQVSNGVPIRMASLERSWGSAP